MTIATQMDKDAALILKELGTAELHTRKDNPNAEFHEFDPSDIQVATGLTPDAVKDAIELLETKGFVELIRSLDSSPPYRFTSVILTTTGRREYQRLCLAVHF